MSASVLPPTPPRTPIVGTLTLAHLRPRTTAVPAASPAKARVDGEARPARRIAVPLKGEKPKRLDAPSAKAATPMPTPVAQQEIVVAPALPARRPRTAEEELLRQFHRLVHARWPATFPMRDMTSGHIEVPPLALGVREEVVAALAEHLTAEQVGLCLKRWTTRRAYLEGTIRHFEAALPRVRPDGTPTADLITKTQADRARYMLAQRLKSFEERKAREGEASVA